MKQKYDVVIVGTGVSGCFSALHLPTTMNILMITKSKIEESDSFLAQGGICVLKTPEDYDSFFKDTMHAGHYQNRKESVDIMIRSSRDIIDELIYYGVRFANENGNLLYTKEGAHSTNRILYHDDITGKEITSTLLEKVEKQKNITLLTHTTMVDILEHNKNCDGIIACLQNGKILPIYSSYVIWACGGIGGIYKNSTNFPHLTGDALAISLKHKIKLKDMDYAQIHPTTLYSKKPGRRFLISESVRGEGAVLLDKNHNRFVDELLPRDIVTKEIHKQMEKDNTPNVWLSMDTIKGINVKTRFPNIYDRCLEEGFDCTKTYIPVVPAQHYFMGGVNVDLQSMTSLNHLYAVGETSCNGVHGANRLASNSLLESLVFAKRAAQNITEKNAFKKRSDKLNDKDAMKNLKKMYNIELEDYQDIDDFFSECKKNIWKKINLEKKKREQKGVKNEPYYKQNERR